MGGDTRIIGAMIAFRDYARSFLGKLATSGWRNFYAWGLGTMCLLATKFALLDAPRENIQLDQGYYTFLLGCMTLFVATFITRAVEKDRERRHAPTFPGGGLVNREAIT